MSDEERLARRAGPASTLYMVCETDYDSCDHLALVQGPPMPRDVARTTFRGLFEEFTRAHEDANASFTIAHGYATSSARSDADVDLHHDRRRDWLRKAGCWSFPEFLQTRGFVPVEHVFVAMHRREDDADDGPDDTDHGPEPALDPEED